MTTHTTSTPQSPPATTPTSAPVGVAIYGLSGAGKSTTANLVIEACRDRGRSARLIKIGEPLYRLQSNIYDLIGLADSGRQDQQLLRSLATHLRRLNASFLIENFLRRVAQARADGADLIVTDDLRDTATDYPRLVEAGFVFWHITCPEDLRARRLGARADLSVDQETSSTWRFDRITPHATVHNDVGHGEIRRDDGGQDVVDRDESVRPDDSSVAALTRPDQGLGGVDRLGAQVEALLSWWWA